MLGVSLMKSSVSKHIWYKDEGREEPSTRVLNFVNKAYINLYF